jgi:hypothetical protein
MENPKTTQTHRTFSMACEIEVKIHAKAPVMWAIEFWLRLFPDDEQA